jgi:hypothetical protein
MTAVQEESTETTAEEVTEATPENLAEEPAEVTDEESAPVVPDTAVPSTTPKSNGLTLYVGQTSRDLTEPQKAALRAVVSFEPKHYPQSLGHIELFLDLCARRGLNPFEKQAYLLMVGGGLDKQGNLLKDRQGNPKQPSFHIVVAIDGYRKLAADSGRLHSAAKIYWMGDPDDPNSWHVTEDEYGVRIKEPVWLTAWPWKDRHPSAARAVIRHYDGHGELVISDAVADFDMFAPYTEEWEDKPEGKGRRPVKDPVTGKTKRKLSGKWMTSPSYMLGKCVEALVLRKAFPAQTSGVYVREEFDKAVAEDREVTKADATRLRTEEFRAAQAEAAENPAPADGTAAPEAADAPSDGADQEKRNWLLDEIQEIAEIIGKSPREMTKSLVERFGRTLHEVPPEELVGIVGQFRIAVVVPKLRSMGRDAEADALVEAGPALIAPVNVLFGRPDETVTEPEAEGDDIPKHLFEQGEPGDLECMECGEIAEHDVHMQAE